MVGAGILADGRLAKRVVAHDLGDDALLKLEIRDLAMVGMEVKLLDISETGIGIRAADELVLGQIVNVIANVHVMLPQKAVVMWSRKGIDGYRAGLKFIRAS
ncbi:MAG: PilZ domain-containing protein [Desulfurivibrio sp.]|jgi:hypothetical protein|nr:MAG: PilZ domain-containing protein [Desulfurivibrio sp.]